MLNLNEAEIKLAQEIDAQQRLEKEQKETAQNKAHAWIDETKSKFSALKEKLEQQECRVWFETEITYNPGGNHRMGGYTPPHYYVMMAVWAQYKSFEPTRIGLTDTDESLERKLLRQPSGPTYCEYFYL